MLIALSPPLDSEPSGSREETLFPKAGEKEAVASDGSWLRCLRDWP